MRKQWIPGPLPSRVGPGDEAMRASERGHAKEAWLGDEDRVGQKMTYPLWGPGYGPAMLLH